MSANPISKDANSFIDRIMSTTLSGDLDNANAVLKQSELTGDQQAKIEGILKDPRSDMQQRIVAVVENTALTADSSQVPSEQRCISFADAPTSPFGNAYHCTFEFGGKYYQNATACFLAQQYTDQPKILNTFTTLNAEEAVALDELMTEERKLTCENPDAEHINKDEVLMHVQRAKFGQNPDLRKQLLATDGAYLVCQGHDLYLSENMEGSGKNALGTSLMHLRGEYGGVGLKAPPAADQGAKQCLLARSNFIGTELYSDIIVRLFYSFLSECDFKTVSAVACVNKHWNNCSLKFWLGCDLKQLCPELTILDANAQGVNCEDEPKISKHRLLKWASEISSQVEGSEGVTQLTMIKGTTLNQLVEIAKGEGITVTFGWTEIIRVLGDVPVEQTYGILISNSVFLNSRNKDFNSQQILVEGHGCKMPTVQEYVALCVFTNKLFKKCIYGLTPDTRGRSSTHIRQVPLAVGCSAPASLYADFSPFDNEYYGAGGRRKF